MSFYFKLQFRRIQRKFLEIGLKPLIGFIIIPIVFIFFSKYLFYRFPSSGYLYPVLSILISFKLSEKRRNDFLNTLFNFANYHKIRLIENYIFATPFIIFLLLENFYFESLGLTFVTTLLSFIKIKQSWNLKIPTPFKKFPFEFIVGFRKTFFMFPIIYFFCFKAFQIQNFNLGLFSLIAVYLLSFLYYPKPENIYFVWIYSADTKAFLFKKIMNALICSSIISLPILFSLVFFFNGNLWLILAVLIFGILLLASIILAKYSTFPSEMNLLQGIIYGISIWIPPMFLITIPYFYKHSKTNLENILE